MQQDTAGSLHVGIFLWDDIDLCMFIQRAFLAPDSHASKSCMHTSRHAGHDGRYTRYYSLEIPAFNLSDNDKVHPCK